MTKLEKEAEEKYCKGCKWRIEQCLWAWRKTNGLKEPNEKNCSCKEVPAYLAGAEPREKQIEIDSRQIRAFQKQNGELTEQNTSLLTSVENLNKSVQELEAQIEKMKRHANCKHCDSEGYCEVKRTYLIDLSYDGCDKWELED